MSSTSCPQIHGSANDGICTSEQPGRFVNRVKRMWPRLPPALLVFCMFGSLYLLCGKGRITCADGISMLRLTESMVDRGSFAVDRATSPHGVLGKGGLRYSIHGIGKSLANVPAYLAAKLVCRIDSRYPGEYAAHFFVSLINPVVTGLICAYLFLLCEHLGFSARESLLLVAIYGLGTTAFPYAKDDMSEPLAGLGVLMGLYYAMVYARTGGTQWAVKAAFGFGVGCATRYIVCVMPVITALYLIAQWRRNWTGSGRVTAKGLFCYLAIMACVAFGMAMYNEVRFGGATSTGNEGFGGGGGGFSFFSKRFVYQASALLFSPGRGLFSFSPILILAAVGVGPFVRAARDEALLLGAAIMTMVALCGGYVYYAGGFGWGPRLLMPVVPLIVPFLGFGLRRVFRKPSGQVIAWLLIALSIAIQVPAVIVDWKRPLLENELRVARGEVIDREWSVREAHPIRQWESVVEVLSMSESQRLALRTKAAAEKLSAEEYFQVSRGLNVPDFWFVHFHYMGIPTTVLAVPILSLLAVMVSSAWLFWRVPDLDSRAWTS